jgi:hypothetical protein
MKTHTTTDSHLNPFRALAKRLDSWRASRPVGQRIPEELWQKAVSLAQVHGLSATSTALKLYYYGLQRRMGQSRRRSAKVQPATFVELATPIVSAADHGTLELHHPSGSRLTLRWPQARAQELLPLVGIFLRQRV